MSDSKSINNESAAASSFQDEEEIRQSSRVLKAAGARGANMKLDTSGSTSSGDMMDDSSSSAEDNTSKGSNRNLPIVGFWPASVANNKKSNTNTDNTNIPEQKPKNQKKKKSSKNQTKTSVTQLAATMGKPISQHEADQHDADAEQIIIATTAEKLREAERKFATDIYNRNTLPPGTFMQWCTFIFLAHMGQAAVLFVISANNTRKWTWYTNFPDPDTDDLVPLPEEHRTLNVLWLIPFVPLMAALEPLCSMVFLETYKWHLERNQNPFRWTEYTFSAALMKVIIGMQVGITDLHLLILEFFLMMVVIQGGQSHESINAKARSEDRPQNWRNFFTSLTSFIMGWSILFNYFANSVRLGVASQEVWMIIIFEFLLEAAFAVTFVLQWKKIGIFEDYIAGEKIFLLLGLLSKTLLSWLSVANIVNLMRQ